MKKIISIILLSAMLLTACGSENNTEETTVSETTTAEVTTAEAVNEDIQIDEEFVPKENMESEFAKYIFGDFAEDISDIKILESEHSEKLEKSFLNIHINNSRFALPMMVDALPDGFTAEYDYSSGKEYENGFSLYNGQLMHGDETAAEIGIIKKDNADEKHGIIVSIITMSSLSKWDFDGIEMSSDREAIIEKFGEPSADMDLGTGKESMIYINDKGTILVFWTDLNGILTMNLNFENAITNAEFVESISYNDFDNMLEIPELSGKPREFDFNIFFEEDCIIIGNDKYPVNVKLSDLSKDITLFEFDMGKEFYPNKDYLRDTYLLMYKGREIAMVSATRIKDQLPEEAYMTSWMFTEIKKSPVTGSVCGVSFKQDFSSVPEIYIGAGGEAPFYMYLGTNEKDGEKYQSNFLTGETFLIVTLLPRSADPEAYDNFINSQ